MRILGIDPGYATTGFGLLQTEPAGVRLLRYGVITTPKELPFPKRLEILYDDMIQLVAATVPEVAAVEELFWGHNITTGIGVSHGRGVILLALTKAGLPVFEYTPMQVKQAVVGYGKAEKRQVMDMTRRILHMEEAEGSSPLCTGRNRKASYSLPERECHAPQVTGKSRTSEVSLLLHQSQW